jgi:hypothetical protein
VILVAVAIVIAIAVAFWASGLVGIFTRFEKLEIVSAYQDTNNPTDFILIIRNTGTSPTAIVQVVLNGVQVFNPNPPPDFDVGQQRQCTLTLVGNPQAGVTYEIALKSSGGKIYPTTILAHSGAGQPGTPAITNFACQ